MQGGACPLFAKMSHECFHCEGKGIIKGVSLCLLVPSDELMSRIQAELEDMSHFMDVTELVQSYLLVKLVL